MRKIIIGLLLLLSVGASAQWQQTGSKVRYVNGLGIPTKDTAAGVLADSSQIVIRPADSALYIKYKRTWLRVGGGGGSIAGAGTLNRVAKFTSTSAIGNSSIYDNGTAVGINTLTPTTTLQVGDGTGNPEITASGLNYDVVLGTPSGSALGFTTVGNYVGVYSNSATKDLAFTHGNGRAITFGTGNQSRLTITASGRLLANTRTDNGVDALQVNGSGRFTGGISVLGTATFGTGAPTAIDGTDGRIITDKFRMYNSSPASQYHDFTSSATSNRTVTIPNVSGTMLFGTGSTNYVPKFTNANTVGNSLIYDDGTNVGVNTISASGRLTVKTGTNENVSILTGGSGDLRISALNDAGSTTVQLSIQGSPLLFRGSGGSEAMRITTAGELIVFSTTDNGAYNIQCNGTGVWGAGAYVNGSDSALKENILPIDSSLQYVKLLKPVTYKYKKFYSSDSTVQTGFIAQDLMQVFKGKPLLDGLVKQGGKYLSVAYQNLIPLLTKAIQEQQTKIESLEARLAAIEAILKSNKIQ